MAKHTEIVLIHGHNIRTARVSTLKVSGAQLVISALNADRDSH